MDNTNRDWMTEQEIDAFVGENSEYYKEKWKKHPDSQYFKGWNGIALFFFYEWAAYRKMYKEVLFLFLASLIFGILIVSFSTDFVGRLCGQAIKIFLSFLANGLYHRKALRIVNKSLSMDEGARMEYLAKKGGTNISGVFICVILEIAIVFLPTIIIVLIVTMMR